MKICVIFSSYEDSESAFQEYDSYQDPSVWVKSHTFECKFINKSTAFQELDEICSKRNEFDYIWSFLWGTSDDNVAGIDALKYLESKGVPLLGTSSKFLSMTKLDFKKAGEKVGIKTPKWILIPNKECEGEIPTWNLEEMKFPMIIKPINGCGSLHMTRSSVCENETQLKEQVAILRSKIQVDILVEEFIIGSEVSVIVLETKGGVVALTSIIYDFPSDWKPIEKFLDFENKFNGCKTGEIRFRLLEDDTKIKDAGIKAYESLGVKGSGYSRVDFRVTPENEIYLLEINQAPAFFSHVGNAFGDDFVIEKTFPGGHENLVETIIGAKQQQQGIVSHYDDYSVTYQHNMDQPVNIALKHMLSLFEYSGTILDLGSGTGFIGNFILPMNPSSKITGVEVSPKMASITKGYSEVLVGMAENIIMQTETKFDHVISSGMFMWLDPSSFEKVFKRMFVLAKCSVSISVDELPSEYYASLRKRNVSDIGLFSYGHYETVEKWEIGEEWKVAFKDDISWVSPVTGIKIKGMIIRYEKIQLNKNGELNGFHLNGHKTS